MHIRICYHAVREASYAGLWKVGFMKETQNIKNSLTNILTCNTKEKEFENWMWRK